MAVGAHAYRRTIERRAPASMKTKRRRKQNKQNKRNARERQYDIRPEDTSSRHLWLINYGEGTSTSPLALGYPLLGPSHYVWAYYCISTPCSVVLRHSPSFWAVIVHWSALMPKALKVIQETPHLLFSPGEGFNDQGGRGYDDFVPGEVIKTAPSGDETT